jgi:RimJ/RimL family protein N-acetyltransferase
MAVIARTSRLSLRRITEADARLLFDLDSDPEVTRFTGPTLATIEEYAAKISNEFLRYDVHPVAGIFLAESAGEFLGWFLLRPGPDYRFASLTGWDRPSDIELGYRLKRHAWGKGIATEGSAALVARAFAEPSVTGVVAHALVANRGSTRVMEKVGLTRVREFDFPEYGPAVTYARFRESETRS